MSDDLIPWLQTLMRAERAGARVILDSLRQADEAVARHRLERLHQGEAESCRRLRRCLERLGATPDTGVGDFHASAMAIDDLELRFDFIGRASVGLPGRSRSAYRKSMSPGCAKSWRRCCGCICEMGTYSCSRATFLKQQAPPVKGRGEGLGASKLAPMKSDLAA